MVTLFVIITDNRVSVDVCCYCSLMYPLTSAVASRCKLGTFVVVLDWKMKVLPLISNGYLTMIFRDEMLKVFTLTFRHTRV